MKHESSERSATRILLDYLRSIELGRQLSAHTVAAYKRDLYELAAFLDRYYQQEDWTWDFAMLETNPLALEVYYGNYAAGGVKIGGQNTTRGHWAIEVLDGDNILRIVIPDGEITGRGAHSYQTDEGIAYPVTLTAYPDPTLESNAIVYRGVEA